MSMKNSVKIFLILFVVFDDQLVAGQNGCFTICQGEQQPSSQSGPQSGQLQGPPGKRGPNGHVGSKGEKVQSV